MSHQEESNINAIQTLIESLDKSNSIVGESSLNIANRILSSSIGDVTTVSAAARGGRNRKSKSSLVKKIERSYRKRASLSDANASSIEQKLKHVRLLQKELMDSDLDDDIITDLLLLFSRLAGSGTMNSATTSTSSNDAFMSPLKIDITATKNAETKSHRKPHQQPQRARHKNTHSRTPINSNRTDKHVELALRDEELNVLRECIHSLQHIDGNLIKFYHHEVDESSLKETSVYNPNADFDPASPSQSTSNAMQRYNGIRVRPGLLPFELDAEALAKHKSTRLLSSGARDALRVCGEAGWLYSRIQNYVSIVQAQFPTQSQSSSPSLSQVAQSKSQHQCGVVPRALASALMRELNAYHEFLATLDKELPKNGTACDLTLRNLLRILRGPITHLRTLALIVDGIQCNLNGGQLLTDLYLHTMHGDVRHKDISNRILYSASLPWYDLLYDWTIGGIRTAGPQGEFFIVEDSSVTDSNLWHGRYSLKDDQIPHVPGIGCRGGLLSEQMAKDILIVGKGLNFIRKCLHDSEWEFDWRGILPRKLLDDGNNGDNSSRIKVELGFHYDPNSASSFDMSGRCGEILTQTSLEKTVNIASSQVHRHILSSLFEQHHLLEHLHGLKEILFLGQGDFICALMDELHVEFQSRDSINEIYMISLMNIVHGALRSTNAKFLPKYVIDRIQVRLLSEDARRNRFWAGGTKESECEGWDVFTLDYAIDTPLTAIVHPKAMEKYYLVFDMLFRLKRVEWMMNNTWRQSTTLNHSLQLIISKFGNVELGPSSTLKGESTLSRIKRLLRKFSMTRQCMLHFLTNLQSYLMFEVLESGWKDLVNKLKGATTLDEVITSHDEYLNDILAKSLVGEASSTDGEGNGSELPSQLRLVLSAAFRFCKMHDKIFSDGVETIQKATEKRRGALKRSADGDWGFEEFDADVEGLNFKKLANDKILTEVESISEEFDISLRNLLSIVNDRINGISVRDVDISSPSIARPSQTVESDRADASNNDSLRFLTFRLDFSAYYGL